MGDGTILSTCPNNCSAHRNHEEELEAQRRAKEEKPHDSGTPDVEDSKAG